MPKRDAEYYLWRRNKEKEKKEEKKRLGRARAANSKLRRARRRSSSKFRRIDVAIEVEATPVGSMGVEEN